MKKCLLIGAGSDLGVHIDGARKGPKEILKLQKERKILLEQDKKIIKSLSDSDLRKNLKEVNNFNQKLYEVIEKENDFCITIGGDHSIAIASGFASLKKHKNLGLIWIDAHLDYNTFETTITGNLHGLPLATLNGLNEDLRPFEKENFYNPKNTVVVGYRAMESNAIKEIENIKTMGVTVFTTNDINEMGINKVMELALKIANNNTFGVHISFDLDVIDPDIARGVTVKEKNGINLKQVQEITDILIKQDTIKSFDLVEYNPLNDTDKKTLEIAQFIIEKVKRNL